MDIYHWWLIKMVAIQLLCLLGVAWGVRYLWQSRLAAAKLQKISPVPTAVQSQPIAQLSQK
jgi:hypothetical protein